MEMHATEAVAAKLVARIIHQHPFEVPYISRLEIDVQPSYRSWVREVVDLSGD